jgi:hypothetical protein
MMKTETAVMERFIQIIEGDKALINPLFNRYQVYRDMVYFRFYETITNVYPLLCDSLGEKLAPLIREFQRLGASSPHISEMVHEFGVFLQSHPIHAQMPYLEDLLWLEGGEMTLLLANFDPYKVSFTWEGEYSPSTSVRFRQLNYRVYQGEYEERGEYPLLLYYDFKEDRVYFEEITPLGYDLLKLLENHVPKEALRRISLRYEVDQNDLKEPLEELLKQWCDKKILTKEV